MEEEKKVDSETSEGEEKEGVEEGAEDESSDDIAKVNEIAQNQKIRAEKAEERAKKLQAELEALRSAGKEDGNLSQKDVIAIAKADIPEEKVDEVIEYAKFKNIPVSEALQSSYIKTTISEFREMQKSAEVTTTGARRSSTGKLSDDAFLKKVEAGDIPEPGSPDAQRLFDLRHKKK